MAVTNYFSVEGQVRSEKGANGYLYYARDNVGSVSSTHDTSGAVYNTYSYNPYGGVSKGTGPFYINRRFLWCGSWGYSYINKTAQWLSFYVRARHYSALQCMWSSKDELGVELEPANSPIFYEYAYCDGNPVSYIDDNGMQARKPQQGGKPPQKPPKGSSPKQRPQPAKTANAYPRIQPKGVSNTCLLDAIKRHCSGINLSDRDLYGIFDCIIEGESGWTMKPTNITKGSQKGSMAKGPMQLTPAVRTICEKGGWTKWETDPCDNIRCGVKNFCDTMRRSQEILIKRGDPRAKVLGIHERGKWTPPWIHGEICRGQQNAIYEPPGVFDKCLKDFYGTTID